MIAPPNFHPPHSAGAATSAVAAFFDLDGTLLPPPSLEWRFLAYLLAHDDLPLSNIGRWLARFTAQFLPDPRAALLANKSYLAGLPESLVADWQRSLSSPPEDFALAPLPLFREALSHLSWHAAQRHRIFFVSGTLAPLARVVAARASALLGVRIEVFATELELRATKFGDRCFSGRVAGDHLSGRAKSNALRSLAARHGLALDRSFAYGNSSGDLAMLECVGYPVIVNPSRRFTRQIRQSQSSARWPVLHWTSAADEPSEIRAQPHSFSPRGVR
ncbi:MAG: haloacid dehalogenase-like hydrolase [Candidatus Acidiferrales bacterium]